MNKNVSTSVTWCRQQRMVKIISPGIMCIKQILSLTVQNKLPYKKWKHARMKPFSDNETVSLPRGSLNHTWICDLNPLLPIDVHYYLAPKKINNDYIKYDHYTTSTTTRYNYNPNVLFVGTIRTISFTYSYTLINMLHGKCNHFPRNQTVQQTSQGSLI